VHSVPILSFAAVRDDKANICSKLGKNDVAKNQTLHFTRRITPKRVTSLRCPSHHIANAT